ncbi:hypothetical protein LK08_11790 [Streptomyces sp. MUSC 125]|nr:hypothetical protein LK08_11790 [Streptomyces sp. MUSC 125]
MDEQPDTGLIHHWCSGSSGVGTFLLRLWQTAVGEERRLLLPPAPVDSSPSAGTPRHSAGTPRHLDRRLPTWPS